MRIKSNHVIMVSKDHSMDDIKYKEGGKKDLYREKPGRRGWAKWSNVASQSRNKLTSLLLLKAAKRPPPPPASGPLHLLFSLCGMLFPPLSTGLACWTPAGLCFNNIISGRPPWLLNKTATPPLLPVSLWLWSAVPFPSEVTCLFLTLFFIYSPPTPNVSSSKALSSVLFTAPAPRIVPGTEKGLSKDTGNEGIPWWSSDPKDPRFCCWRHGFNLWLGTKIL